MAKNIVFVIHGIGQYTDGWMNLESAAVPALKKASKQYPFFEGKSLDTFVEFVPVLYDDVFERVLQHWHDLGDGLKNAIPVVPAFADKALTLLNDANKDNWALKTGADVVLYWGFRLFQQRVLLRVLAQITQKIAATIVPPDHVTPSYHILAHSLGTAVAHDALHHLGTEDWLASLQGMQFPDADGADAAKDRDAYLAGRAAAHRATGRQNPFDPRNFDFQSVTMLSNVSALITGGESPYHSIVRPGTPQDQGGCATCYFNVNHKFDPISIVGNFQMPAAWQIAGGGGVDIKVDHLDGKDITVIHNAAHYMKNPAVHLPLLKQYVNGYQPTAADVQAIDSYETAKGVAALSADTRKALQRLAQGDEGPMQELVARIKALIPLAGAGAGT